MGFEGLKLAKCLVRIYIKKPFPGALSFLITLPPFFLCVWGGGEKLTATSRIPTDHFPNLGTQNPSIIVPEQYIKFGKITLWKVGSGIGRADSNFFFGSQPATDEPFHNFRASRSGDRRFLCSWGTSYDGFLSSEIVKGFVGYFFYFATMAEHFTTVLVSNSPIYKYQNRWSTDFVDLESGKLLVGVGTNQQTRKPEQTRSGI